MSTPIGTRISDSLQRGSSIQVEVDPMVSVEFQDRNGGIHGIALDKEQVLNLVYSLECASKMAFEGARR